MEECFHQVVIHHGELGGLGCKLRFRSQAFGILVFRNLCQIKVGGSGCLGLGGWVPGIHRGRIVGYSCLGVLLHSNFCGDVGAREGTAVDAQFLADGFGEEGHVL